MDPYYAAVLWIVIVGFVIAFVLAFGVGANDVANSFGTSVGSGALTIKQACILATIFEIAGAILIGYKVSDTVRKGIIDVDLYNGREEELMLGSLSALAGSAIWLLVATFFKLPVSTTHSIVGSTVGYSLVAHGASGVHWNQIYIIIASWFISPLSSGIVSVILFFIIRYFIVRAGRPMRAALIAMPIFYGITLFINVFSIVHDGSKLLGLSNVPLWLALVSALASGAVLSIIVQLFVVPWQRNKIYNPPAPLPEKDISKLEMSNGTMTEKPKLDKKEDLEQSQTSVHKVFTSLQILTAIFGSFAHGGNDVSNAIGPLIAIWMVYTEGSVDQKSESPIWILLYGGVGISIGLWVLGRRVIQTIGTDLAKITPTTGFTIEMGSALTVLIASKIGIPISTTHCKVGSVVLVGHFDSKSDDKSTSTDNLVENEEVKKQGVDWSLFRNIFFAWMITVPVSGLLSAGLMWALSFSL